MKRPPTEWEKILTNANEATDKGLIPQIYKHLLQLNIKKKKKSKNVQGVPFVAWQLTNPTRIPEDAGLIPGLTHWVKDLALP